jgi:hypothetical protein
VRQREVSLVSIEHALRDRLDTRFATIVRLGPIEPYAFGTAYPTSSVRTVDGRYDFAFMVLSRIDVVVREPRLSLAMVFGPPLALGSGMSERELLEAKEFFNRQAVGYEEQTVTLELREFIRATVVNTGPNDENYSDLQLMRTTMPADVRATPFE